ncbi:MAG: hypothetical protein IJV06_06980, partial [Bacteroidaceae bacterium]|nr:hypothetical protein [Bacteroidaceae bacterium]
NSCRKGKHNYFYRCVLQWGFELFSLLTDCKSNVTFLKKYQSVKVGLITCAWAVVVSTMAARSSRKRRKGFIIVSIYGTKLLQRYITGTEKANLLERKRRANIIYIGNTPYLEIK